MAPGCVFVTLKFGFLQEMQSRSVASSFPRSRDVDYLWLSCLIVGAHVAGMVRVHLSAPRAVNLKAT